MTKSKQINITKEILTVLKIADPNSVLAGGAVRDWRILDIAGRDLDFYTSLPAHRSEEQIQELIASALMGTNVRKLGNKEASDNYEGVTGLKHVFEFERDGQLCNLMIMEPSVMTTFLNEFDLSICQAAFDGKDCYYSKDFETTLETGICFLHKDVREDAKHVIKIATRFPYLRFVKEVKVPRPPQVDTRLEEDDIPW